MTPSLLLNVCLAIREHCYLTVRQSLGGLQDMAPFHSQKRQVSEYLTDIFLTDPLALPVAALTTLLLLIT